MSTQNPATAAPTGNTTAAVAGDAPPPPAATNPPADDPPPAGDPPAGTPAPASGNPPGDPAPDGDPPPGDGEQGQPDEVPETYAAPELPEGIVFDEGLATKITPLLRELGVKQENFDKLAQVVGEHQAAAWSEVESGWLDQLQKDPELNANDGQLRKAAVAAFGKYGTPEAKEAMNTLRWGNNPELVRIIGRLALKAGVLEDGGTDSAASGGGPRSFADRFYPNMAKS